MVPIPTATSPLTMSPTDYYLLELAKVHFFSQQTFMESVKFKKREDYLDTIAAASYCIEELETVVKLFDQTQQERTSMNENKGEEIMDPETQDKERYLCVSDGKTICILDLKQTKDEYKDYYSGVQKVPSKIYTCNLLEKGLPFSIGLFKLGSRAFMGDGQACRLVKFPDPLDLKQLNSILECFYKEYGVCSSDIINPMPIVEIIDNRRHVIQCLPSWQIHSHTVLDLNASSGHRDLAIDHPIYLTGYMVVGHHMFARLSGDSDKFAVFDSRTNEWGLRAYPQPQLEPEDCDGLFLVRHVAELLQFGFGRCIGQIVVGESSEPLNVVLALGNALLNDNIREEQDGIAVAYLVTKTGQVLCYQRINHFFAGFEKPPYVLEGTVMSCGRGQGCAIVPGDQTDSLYITTFTWEEVEDAVELLVSELQANIVVRDDEEDLDKLPFVQEEYFVDVLVQGCYKTQFGTGLFTYEDPTRLTACFL